MKQFLPLVFFLLVVIPRGISQINPSGANASFLLKGKVVYFETNQPIARVNIEVLGGSYTTTNTQGQFTIRVRIGDELVIKNDTFDTVYYTIVNEEDLTIKVQDSNEELARFKSVKRQQSLFPVWIDSAKAYLKIDAAKSINYVTQALESVSGVSPTPVQNQMAFETLGDINLFWGQPDLAVANFKQSIKAVPAIETQIKLALSFSANKNYQESLTTYQQVLNKKVSPYQEVQVYEGLGDTYQLINETNKSLENYQKGLRLANAKKITPKIIDLNSKIGAIYANTGATLEAESYFSNSLQLSETQNKKRAVAEKSKVADFYNSNRDFEKEIKLRNETLNDIHILEEDTPLEVTAPLPQGALSAQGQNYKIANAYVAQEKYVEAIPFLEKSITLADKNEDLIVEKDATRKLSEVYRDLGAFDKAASSYEKYVAVVDELYIKKEQEISQAARFSKEMALRQNRIASLESERSLNESRYQLAVENQNLVERNSRTQKWIIGSLILIALLLLWALYSQFKSVKQQQFANNQLALKSLRSQMNPHFIFNALNSVNSFIATQDERAANRYLSDFSQLMRSVLENSEEDFIPLAKEIELLSLYTKLEHFRFQNKFEYHITVDEAIPLEEFVIPPMLLQPYVENAVWHGLRYKKEKGELNIQLQLIKEDTVIITISDNGIGRINSKQLKTENQKKQTSKGMGNIKKRIDILNKMYKDKVAVTISDLKEDTSGTVVTLLLKKEI